MSVCKHAAGSVGGGAFAPCQRCNRIAPAPQPPADATPHANDCVCLTCVPHCPPPTKAEFDALPSRWRRYVADLETNCDPGGMVRENAMLRDRVVQLEALVKERPAAPPVTGDGDAAEAPKQQHGGEGLGCDECQAESPPSYASKTRGERAVAAGWLVTDDSTLCPRCCNPAGPPVTGDGDEWRRRALAAEALINAPEIIDFAKAVQLEAAHQRSRWGSDHDAGKADADWFWLLGYLGGKALRTDDGPEKQLHRIITVAAAASNWHAAKLGLTNMRPGIETPKGLPPDDFDMSVFKNNGKEPVLR